MFKLSNTLLAVPLIMAALPGAAQAQLIANGSFETESIDPWVSEGGISVSRQNLFAPSAGPVGAIIRLTSPDAFGSFSQSFTVATAGTYAINFFLGRGEGACGCTDVPLTFKALVDTTEIANTLPDSVTSVPFFTELTRYDRSVALSAGTHRLAFEFSRSATLFGRGPFFVLDGVDVALTAATPGVPEPASWAMMIAGFGLVGSAARRRSNARVVAKA